MGKNKEKSQSQLLACLSFLTAYYGQARSVSSLAQSLAAGDEGGVGVGAVEEAAENSDISSGVFEKKFDELVDSDLPVILLTGADTGYVLLEKDGKQLRVYDPVQGKERSVEEEELKRAYVGKIIRFKPNSEPENDSMLNDKTNSKEWFWTYFKDNIPTYKLVVVASLLINVFALATPIFIMNMYDRVIPNSAIETGWALALGAMIVLGFDLVMRILRGRFIDLAGRRIDVLAGAKIYDHLLNMKLSHRPESSGVLAGMLKEFDAVREFLTSATIATLVDLPFAFLFILIIAFIAGPLAFVPLLVLCVIIASGYVLQISMKKDVLKAMRSGEERHGTLIETINGLETIKAIGADRRLRSRYTEHLGNMARYGESARGLSHTGISFAHFAQQSMTILIVLFGMYMVQSNSLTIGALIAAVILAGRASAPMGQLANLMARYYQTKGALETVSTIMAAPEEKSTKQNYIHREKIKGAVRFDGVSFSYPGTDRKVLDNISFSVKDGEKVAVIGRIGSGKSTIARLLMGLYEPDSGQIFVEDTDQAQIDPTDLRRNFAYIAQDITLFRGTVRDNLTAARFDASEKELLNAAEKSGVSDFTRAHPMGLEAPVGEGGRALSGGQRQAVALGRAMLMNPSLYICDEPTNAMDIQAENAFTKHIKQEVRGKSLILITHRLSLLEIVDRIIVVEQGQIVMDGPREDVIKSLSGGGVHGS